MASTGRIQAEIVELNLTTTAAASVETVWRCLVDAIDTWWGEPYVASAEDRKQLTLDATPGGLLLEDWGDGNGLIWATVRAVKKPYEIEFDGTFNMDGALQGRTKITLSETGGGTEIALRQRAMGNIDDSTIANFDGGWTDLLNRLISHCESDAA